MQQLSEFQCYLRVYFDNDFDVNIITEKLKIEPHFSVRFVDAGYTRVKNQKKSGVWWYFFPSKQEYKSGGSLQEILQDFFNLFSQTQLKELKELINFNNGKVILGINIYFKHAHLPELCFEGEVMQIIRDLNANIHINMNEDVEEN